MIICPWKDILRYAPILPGLEEAVEKINALTSLEPATYQLSNGGRFMVNVGTTVPAEGGKPEAHREFIDVQYIVKGEELMGWADLSTLTPAGEFNSDNDCGFYEGHSDLIPLPGRLLLHRLPRGCAYAHPPHRQDHRLHQDHRQAEGIKFSAGAFAPADSFSFVVVPGDAGHHRGSVGIQQRGQTACIAALDKQVVDAGFLIHQNHLASEILGVDSDEPFFFLCHMLLLFRSGPVIRVVAGICLRPVGIGKLHIRLHIQNDLLDPVVDLIG